MRVTTLLLLPMLLALAGCGAKRGVAVRSGPTGGYEDALASKVHAASAPDAQHRSRYDITLEEVLAHVENGSASIIDARSSGAYARDHVRGALNLPSSDRFEAFVEVEPLLDRNQLVVVYCHSAFCSAADHVADMLERNGFTQVLVFRGGWVTLSRNAALLASADAS